MIQLNADHHFAVNFSPEKPLRASYPLSAPSPKLPKLPELTRSCWPFTATARFTVVASGIAQDSSAPCGPVSSFIT
jgi:hypothetical protein